jgi:uncharacterized circularly permuted ATP-grasp superfamily protein/uncharacterized alpha-E superfamily protein
MESSSPPRPAWTAYREPQLGHDEVFLADGQVREHWQYLLQSLDSLGPDAISERERKARRILRDDGATYNDYSQAQNSRVWSMDPIPLLIDSEQWAQIESGLQERAELLNLVLKDIYGERQLLRHGVIPPEVIYSHSGFLRPCQGLLVPGDHQLIQYAADMVRAADGSMCVVADRSQAPSGTGYALENRTVMSRVFPSLYRDSHVHRLSLYFQRLRAKLSELNPGNDIARIVILSPGSYNETYFEQAYLANYLGFPLVQGSDLTVRDGYVWMKALDGLRRVDVILRRVDDNYCDPVELKGDSQLGIPGLLEVIRMGRIVVANPLGSSVLENPALLRYMPDIARFFLGRELRLAAVKTFWCGDLADRDHVLANVHQLVVKPISRGPDLQSVFGPDLDPQQLEQTRQAIVANPVGYVAQEYIRPSSLPVWQNNELQPRSAILRSFAVASGTSYSVMPGGLTRAGRSRDSVLISNKLGSLSKDTWVLASEPEKQVTLRNEAEITAPIQPWDRLGLPSRVVENLFWVGRYAERAESALRLLRTVFVELHGVEPLPPATYPMLLRAVTHLTNTYPGFVGGGDALLANPEPELLAVASDRQRTGSIASSLNSLLVAAEEIKETLSVDMQRIINDIRDELKDLQHKLQVGMTAAPEAALDPLVTALMALSGLTHESMMRGVGWHFMEMGRRLERSWQTISQVRSLLVPVVGERDEEVLLEVMLLSVEGLNNYRHRYNGQMAIANGLELVLLEPVNPRSLLYQLEALYVHLAELPAASGQRGLPAFSRLVLEASTALKLSDPVDLAQFADGDTVRDELDQLLARVQQLLADTSLAIADRFFDHGDGPQPLLMESWEA